METDINADILVIGAARPGRNWLKIKTPAFLRG
jgi:hypothetical protein